MAAGFFLLFFIWAAFFVLGELIRPRPDIEDAKPYGLGDFNFPTATEGRTVPIIWGRVKIKGPNCVWYGNLRTQAIKKKYKTGIFSSDEVITGFRYFIGLQLAICRGVVDQIHHIWINEKEVSTGTSTDGYREWVSIASLFGGDEHGQGGMSGHIAYYLGTNSATANSYMTTQTGTAIAYRGTCYVVFEGGYMGTSPTVHPWHFEVSRIPDGLGLASYDPGSEKPNTWDANPMNVIYEIMTDTDWGLAIPVSQIDLANFRSVGSVLASEGNGFSMVLDNEREASDVLNLVVSQIDGSLYFDREAGLWRCILARDDYSPTGLDIYDEDLIAELTSFSRTTWQETTNQVRILFVDRDDGYKDTFAFAQDMANNILQNGTVSVDVTFPGVMNRTLANKLAWRELGTLSFPLAKIDFTVNRAAFDLVPGSVFKFSWARLGITEVVFRVARIDYGNITEGLITVSAVQDIFAAGTGVFADPPGSGWLDPSDAAAAPTSANSLVFEAPGQMVANAPINSTLNPRMWMGARDPGGGTISLGAYLKWGTARPIGGSYPTEQDAIIYNFLLAGSLETALSAYGGTAARPAIDYYIRINDNDPDDLSELVTTGNETAVISFINLIYIEGEFIGFENMTDIGGGVYRLEGIYRGLFNSAPMDHAVDTRIWFIGQTGGGLSQTIPGASYDEVDIQLRGRDKFSETTEASTPTLSPPTITNTWQEPLPPRDPVLFGSYAPTSAITLDTQYTTETGLSGDDARALKTQFTPRNWREINIIMDAIFDATDYLADNPEFDVKLTLDPDGSPVDTETFNISGTGTDTPVTYILRNSVIIAVGANASIPTTGRLVVTAKHQPTGFSSVVSAVNDMEFDFTVSSALQSADDLVFGGLVKDTASAAVVFGETGTYTFDIHFALPSSGILEINVNSTGWNTVVTAGNSSGTYSITATDSVQLRFDQYPANDQFFDITGPTAELGYGVLKAL